MNADTNWSDDLTAMNGGRDSADEIRGLMMKNRERERKRLARMGRVTIWLWIGSLALTVLLPAIWGMRGPASPPGGPAEVYLFTFGNLIPLAAVASTVLYVYRKYRFNQRARLEDIQSSLGNIERMMEELLRRQGGRDGA